MKNSVSVAFFSANDATQGLLRRTFHEISTEQGSFSGRIQHSLLPGLEITVVECEQNFGAVSGFLFICDNAGTIEENRSALQQHIDRLQAHEKPFYILLHDDASRQFSEIDLLKIIRKEFPKCHYLRAFQDGPTVTKDLIQIATDTMITLLHPDTFEVLRARLLQLTDLGNRPVSLSTKVLAADIAEVCRSAEREQKQILVDLYGLMRSYELYHAMLQTKTPSREVTHANLPVFDTDGGKIHFLQPCIEDLVERHSPETLQKERARKPLVPPLTIFKRALMLTVYESALDADMKQIQAIYPLSDLQPPATALQSRMNLYRFNTELFHQLPIERLGRGMVYAAVKQCLQCKEITHKTLRNTCQELSAQLEAEIKAEASKPIPPENSIIYISIKSQLSLTTDLVSKFVCDLHEVELEYPQQISINKNFEDQQQRPVSVHTIFLSPLVDIKACNILIIALDPAAVRDHDHFVSDILSNAERSKMSIGAAYVVYLQEDPAAKFNVGREFTLLERKHPELNLLGVFSKATASDEYHQARTKILSEENRRFLLIRQFHLLLNAVIDFPWFQNPSSQHFAEDFYAADDLSVLPKALAIFSLMNGYFYNPLEEKPDKFSKRIEPIYLEIAKLINELVPEFIPNAISSGNFPDSPVLKRLLPQALQQIVFPIPRPPIDRNQNYFQLICKISRALSKYLYLCRRMPENLCKQLDLSLNRIQYRILWYRYEAQMITYFESFQSLQTLTLFFENLRKGDCDDEVLQKLIASILQDIERSRHSIGKLKSRIPEASRQVTLHYHGELPELTLPALFESLGSTVAIRWMPTAALTPDIHFVPIKSMRHRFEEDNLVLIETRRSEADTIRQALQADQSHPNFVVTYDGASIFGIYEYSNNTYDQSTTLQSLVDHFQLLQSEPEYWVEQISKQASAYLNWCKDYLNFPIRESSKTVAQDILKLCDNEEAAQWLFLRLSAFFEEELSTEFERQLYVSFEGLKVSLIRYCPSWVETSLRKLHYPIMPGDLERKYAAPDSDIVELYQAACEKLSYNVPGAEEITQALISALDRYSLTCDYPQIRRKDPAIKFSRQIIRMIANFFDSNRQLIPKDFDGLTIRTNLIVIQQDLFRYCADKLKASELNWQVLAEIGELAQIPELAEDKMQALREKPAVGSHELTFAC